MVLTLGIAALYLIKGASALLPLVTEGNKFYQLQEDYTHSPVSFPIEGVQYQPLPEFNAESQEDALSNAQRCQRDAFLLKQLGANAIRVSQVSPWTNHDQCMTVLNAAGIYVMIDLNTPMASLDALNPAGTYDRSYLNNVFGLIDAFKDYPNVIGFIAGSGLIDSAASAQADSSYVRAIIRDVKQYIERWADRPIPVGYSAGDVSEGLQGPLLDFIGCDSDSSNATLDAFAQADFFGISAMSWCDSKVDYDSIATGLNSSTIPIFVTDFGCSKPNVSRSFSEVDNGILGGSKLSSLLSGGFAYEYAEWNATDKGLVSISPEENVSCRKDFEALRTAYGRVHYTQTSASVLATGTSTLTAVLDNSPKCTDVLTSGVAANLVWKTLPDCPASDMIATNGGNRNIGSLAAGFPVAKLSYSWTLTAANGSTYTPTYTYDQSFQVNSQTNTPGATTSAAAATSTSAQASQTSAASSKVTGQLSLSAAPGSNQVDVTSTKNGAALLDVAALPISLGAALSLILSLI